MFKIQNYYLSIYVNKNSGFYYTKTNTCVCNVCIIFEFKTVYLNYFLKKYIIKEKL